MFVMMLGNLAYLSAFHSNTSLRK